MKNIQASIASLKHKEEILRTRRQKLESRERAMTMRKWVESLNAKIDKEFESGIRI